MTTASKDLAEARAELARALKFIETMLGYAWSADAAGRFTYVSPNALAFLGAAREDLNRSEDEDEFGWRRVVHPDDYDRVAARWRHCLQTGDHYDTEHRLRRADGVYGWFRSSGRPSRDSQGRITEWYGTTIDIEEQKQAETALRERERELSQLVDMAPSLIWRLTPDGEPTFFNRRMVDFHAMDVADLDKPGMSRLEAVLETVHPDDVAGYRDALNRCLATGESFTSRYRLRRADGVYRWMSSRAEAMLDQDGRIIQWYGLCHDIDDQVQAEEALRRSEQQLQQLVDAVPVMIWSATPEGRPAFVNKRWRDVTGTTLEDNTAPDGTSPSYCIIHPDDRDAAERTLAHSFKSGVPSVRRYRQIRRDGSYRWTEVRVEPLRDDAGDILQWYGVSVDIDDQMRLYSDIEEREAKIRRLVDSNIIGIVIWDLDGRLIDANDAFLRMVQYEREDLQAGLRWFDMTPPEWQDVHARYEAEELKTTGVMQAREKEFFRKDGSRVPVLIGAACFEGQSKQGVAYLLDLTERKRAEAALRERERELSQLVDVVPSQVWRLAPDGEPTFYNKRLVDFLGMDVADVAAMDKPGMRRLAAAITAHLHPDDRASLAEALSYSLTTGERFSMRFRQRRADGVYRWVESRAEPLRDDSGVILEWYGTNVDIDDLVTSQEALRQSERRYRDLFHYMPIGLAQVDASKLIPMFKELRAQGVTDLQTYIDEHPEFLPRAVEALEIEEVNQHIIEMFGARNAQEMGGPITRYWQPGIPTIRRSIEARYRGQEVLQEETKVARMDGSVIDVLFTTARPSAVADKSLVGFVDITERKKAEQALRSALETVARASQAASLAELSASIAHEVNQPLAAIVFNSHACHRWLSAEPPNVERAKITAERIIRDANVAADVVSRIRALFKQSAVPRSSTALTSVIAEACNHMAEEAARRRLHIDVDVESNLPLLTLDRVQIQQVLINLMRNGMDAMDSIAGDRVLAVRVRRIGDAVQIEISDRGPGVEFPDKIFEPFFTTKEHGMGMGLAICRSIVESHGGRLWTERNEPHGARFIITLPVEV